jgi:hypothetical protein
MTSYRKSDLTFFARERADGRYGFWWLADSATWAAAKNDLRASFPHYTGLKYDGQAREWTVPRYSVERLQRWADAWAGRQEWNAAQRNGQQRHYERTQDAPAASASSPYRVLYLVPDAPLWAAEAVYRAGAKLAHPDVVGGDHAQAVALNTAIREIREAQERQARAS